MLVVQTEFARLIENLAYHFNTRSPFLDYGSLKAKELKYNFLSIKPNDSSFIYYLPKSKRPQGDIPIRESLGHLHDKGVQKARVGKVLKELFEFAERNKVDSRFDDVVLEKMVTRYKFLITPTDALGDANATMVHV